MKNFIETIKKFKVAISIGAIVLFGLLIFNNFPITQAQKLNAKCQQLSKNDVADEQQKYQVDFRFLDVNSFYSKALNTCLQTRVSELDNSFLIRDIARNFIKDNLEGSAETPVGNLYGKTVGNIFYCNEEGVDNTRIDVVRQHDGYISQLAYKDYLDDFNDGPARAIKTPDKKFSKDDCQKLFERKLQEVK